ncbi:MAG: hypothetical protein R2881_04040 [Eubacteriales bacterium]
MSLVAVTTVAGNVEVEHTTRNTLQVLSLAAWLMFPSTWEQVSL